LLSSSRSTQLPGTGILGNCKHQDFVQCRPKPAHSARNFTWTGSERVAERFQDFGARLAALVEVLSPTLAHRAENFLKLFLIGL